MGFRRVTPVLVILAAGMGSRYGGLKQMDVIGPGGEAILDYSVFDALRSGFGKVIFVIRRAMEEDFRGAVLSRMEGKLNYELAFQELGSRVPPAIADKARGLGRTKPWGTGHALLCAADKIDAPFCVINADDFYGRQAFALMGAFLSGNSGDGAIVPYKLAETLSGLGSVSRGVCTVKDGLLAGIRELRSLRRNDDGRIINEGEDSPALADDTPVSMNFWGFPPSVLPCLENYFIEFLAARGLEPGSECFLPLAADTFIKKGILCVRVLEAQSSWFGVTYKEDLGEAREKIRAAADAGVYPGKLWIS